MKLTFAFSPCPNDTFMFEPIVNKRIDTMGIDFDIILDEVEVLNQAAKTTKYDISKLSFNALTKLSDTYLLCTSGSALGRGCGPILVARPDFDLSDISSSTVAIPGEDTTANLLMEVALPHAQNKKVIVFHDIEKAVSEGTVDAGLLIHESRFTYMNHGLTQLMDLGQFWEDTTSMPIPLGGIAVAKRIDPEIQKRVNTILFDSINYAFRHPKSGLEYIRSYAQEMDEEVMYKHIDLYVNDYSLNLGITGKQSIEHLYRCLHNMGKLASIPAQIWVS